MSDLISRGKLFNLLAPVQTLGEAYGIIQGMETVDAVPVRCKDCKSYEGVHWEKVDKFPVIVANHVCMKWGKGCQTDPDGYCFLAERKDGGDEQTN